MAELTSDETGAREFRAAFDGPLPGAPFMAPAALHVRITPGASPAAAVEVRFFPEALEVLMRLPALAAAARPPFDATQAALALAGAQPVVIYEAPAAIAAAVPATLDSLAAFEAYFTGEGRALLGRADFQLVGLGTR